MKNNKKNSVPPSGLPGERWQRSQRGQRRRRQILAGGLQSSYILFIYTAERVELHISVFLAFEAVECDSDSDPETVSESDPESES